MPGAAKPEPDRVRDSNLPPRPPIPPALLDDAAADVSAAHDCCAGANQCKGRGNCKTDDHDCAGKNLCKGQGGCKPEECDYDL